MSISPRVPEQLTAPAVPKLVVELQGKLIWFGTLLASSFERTEFSDFGLFHFTASGSNDIFRIYIFLNSNFDLLHSK